MGQAEKSAPKTAILVESGLGEDIPPPPTLDGEGDVR